MIMRKKFTTALDDELVARAKIQAIKEKRSVADILEELLSKYLASVTHSAAPTEHPQV